jgi:hypothetical protein
LLPSCHQQLQNKQVVEEQDQQRMFVAKNGCLGQNLQRMFGIKLAKKCAIDQHFFKCQFFCQKMTLKFKKSKLNYFWKLLVDKPKKMLKIVAIFFYLLL